MHADVFLERVRGGLIVSCQALPDEPLHGPHIMARMALAAKIGGAAAIRANGPDDIRAIKAAVNLPVIGLYKEGSQGVYITPTFNHARQLAQAGADVIALDATRRPRPDGVRLEDLIARIKVELSLPVLADVATLDEALAAQAAGVDFAAPTLSGYTDYSPQLEGPDFDLIRRMAEVLHIPIIAEGRISRPKQARQALDAGAAAVVVGSAITRPRLITASFTAALRDDLGGDSFG